jgi:hypothetical protein
MTEAERQAALDRLKEFASQQRGADELADKGSLDRAADIVALYDDRAWVAEVPAPKVRHHRGRPVDPESFSRFTKWLNERARLGGAHAYRLRDAHELQTTYFSNGEIKPRGEHELRPLKWLTKHDYGDRIPEVWREACRLAGDSAPDSPTVRRALSQWKRDNLPRSETSSGTRGGQALVDRWLRDAHRIMEQYPELFVQAVDRIEAEAEEFFTHKEEAAA